MRRVSLLICLAALLFALTACARGTVYSRVGTDSRIELTITHLDGALDQTLSANAGDAIAVSASDLTGTMRVTIAQSGQEPIYDGSNLPESFSVNVAEAGEYMISVRGNGSGSFVFEVVDA